MSYLRNAPGIRQTPQSEKIPGSSQIPNSAGGYAWKVAPIAQLLRFIVLGSETGSYYIGERDLTKTNVASFAQCDPYEAIDLIVAVSEDNRAPKNDPAIFALAYFAGYGGPFSPPAANIPEATIAIRRAALDALPRVCRTGTHVLHFLDYVEKFRGHGPALNKALARWWTREDLDALAYQVVKYRSRDNWSQRDAVRLTRPKPPTGGHDALFRWLVESGGAEVKGDRSERYTVRSTSGYLPRIVEGFQKAQAAKTPGETVALIKEYNLPREALNTDHLRSPDVWEALLYAGQKTIPWVAPEVVERYGGIENVPEDVPRTQKVVGGMPLGALIRNLATMTRVGLIAPFSEHQAEITRRITDAEALKKSRIHPLGVLAALKTYEEGKSARGDSTWEPDSKIVDALDSCFYASFGNVEPTGKRIVLALDVSSSMDGMVHRVTPKQWIVNGQAVVNGVPGLTARIASAAMALVTAAVEKDNHYFLAFSDRLIPVEISPRERLDAVVRKFQQIGFGGTDCALPMLWAAGARFGEPRWQGGQYVRDIYDGGQTVPVDAFVTYTDAETHNGGIHPSQALTYYREQTGITARAVVVGMVSNSFTTADPNDPGQLDVVGFDASAPAIISDFIAGRI